MPSKPWHGPKWPPDVPYEISGYGRDVGEWKQRTLVSGGLEGRVSESWKLAVEGQLPLKDNLGLSTNSRALIVPNVTVVGRLISGRRLTLDVGAMFSRYWRRDTFPLPWLRITIFAGGD